MIDDEQDGPQTIDVWPILERSVNHRSHSSLDPSTARGTNESSTPIENKSGRGKWFALDVVSVIVWSYAVMQFLGIDLAVRFLRYVAPEAAWLADYRALIVIVVLPVIAFFFWRWHSLFVILYIACFPLVVLFWKIPRALFHIRTRSSLLVVLNGAALALRNLRYNLISKSIALAAALIVGLASGGTTVLFAGAVLGVILLWSSWRTARLTFSADWFLEMQIAAIDRIERNAAVQHFLSVRKTISSPSIERLSSDEVSQVGVAITATAVSNRALLYWAYRLQQYRKQRLAMIFNSLAYVWLLLGAALAFGLMNLALYKYDPNQFAFRTPPSALGMLVYGSSTLFFSDGAGIASQGDAAHFLRLFGGIYGTAFIVGLLTNLLFSWRGDRSDRALDQTVSLLREKARAQEVALVLEVDVGVDEALRRLVELGIGFPALALGLTRSIPPDFLEDNP